jgi:hypothetical protein
VINVNLEENGISQEIHVINLLNTDSQQLSKEIKTIKQSSNNKFLTELTQDSITDYSLWKATKYLKRLIAQVPPIKTTDGRWARNNLEKANTFAQHLEKRFHPYPGLCILPVLNSNDYLGKIPLATPREVAEEIRTNLNPQKAHGFDLIIGEILKNFKALVKLTTLINACIRLYYIPNAWKTAEVINYDPETR